MFEFFLHEINNIKEARFIKYKLGEETSINLYYLKCLINKKNIRNQIKILYKIGTHQFFQLMETT